MAASIIPDEIWQRIETLLPSRPISPRGGRPPIGDREVLTGIVFVLRTGIPWEELPHELGCGCGMTCLRRLRSWQRAGVWPEIQNILESGVVRSRRIEWDRVGSGFEGDGKLRLALDQTDRVAVTQAGAGQA